MGDAHDSVGGVLDPWVGNILDTNILRAVENGCSH
jgi:hypothetical protein